MLSVSNNNMLLCIGWQSYLWLPFIPLIVSFIRVSFFISFQLSLISVICTKIGDPTVEFSDADCTSSGDKATGDHNQDGNKDTREGRGGSGQPSGSAS